MTDVTFGGTDIKAGRYSLIAIPTAKNWTLKLNTELDGWGNYGYDSSKDIATITAPVTASSKEIENLSIALYEASAKVIHLKIGWDTTIFKMCCLKIELLNFLARNFLQIDVNSFFNLLGNRLKKPLFV